MTDLIWKPIKTWPREQTVDRERSPFTRPRPGAYGRDEVGWVTTRPELIRELRQLGVEEAVVQLAVTDRDIRIDGEIRADARLAHPGVILTFVSPAEGTMTFACDRWTTWQANIRGITKGLEALRLVERYGITSSGEQYAGWKQIGSGIPMSNADPEPMTVEQAGQIVVGWISETHEVARNGRIAVEDPDYRRYAYRQAVRHLHPDRVGGDTRASDALLRLQAAMKLLDENDDN